MTKARDLRSLFNNSHDEGSLSRESHSILNLPDLGAKIQQGLGIAVDDVPSAEAFLLTLLVDDSGSIASAGNDPLIIEGYNAILEALQKSKQANGILMHARTLNGDVITPYLPIAQCPQLSPLNYSATGGTPLYDESVTILGTVLAKTQELIDAGIPSRSITVILTDGGDCSSTRHDARAVRAIVRDMLKAETHIVAAVGVSDGSTDFRQVFRDMGIEDRWILTPKSTKADIRAAFRVIEQTTIMTSRDSGRFSQVAAGGFGG